MMSDAVNKNAVASARGMMENAPNVVARLNVPITDLTTMVRGLLRMVMISRFPMAKIMNSMGRTAMTFL